jgi:FkbM family methyltransferase
MVTARGLLETIKTTRNFWVTFFWLKSDKRVEIIFRNGCKAELDLLEYRRVLSILSQGYSIESLGKLLCFKKSNFRIAGPISLLGVLGEGLDEIYSVDCANKTVLDIGGFIGDSAVYFSAAGAKKIVIYEPVVAHHEFIKTNVMLNNINAELHEEGIGENDGTVVVSYGMTDDRFGLTKTDTSEQTLKQMKIKIKSVRKVIEESGASIAKIDCEGAEGSLVGVPPKVLQLIESYIIEIHSSELKRLLIYKFLASGFELVKDIPNEGAENISTVCFKRISESSK